MEKEAGFGHVELELAWEAQADFGNSLEGELSFHEVGL